MAIKLEPLTNEKALEFWKDKVLLSPGQFAKLSDAAKVRAFGISGIARGAELESVFNLLQTAIEKGISYDTFKSDLAPIWERRGWTGPRAWRVDNIFRTNIQTAYSVGRFAQMMEAAGDRPYWQYDAVNDRRTRPTHRAVDGKIYRFDHPFWDTWYPPNGFRCRCGVNTLSADEIERDGLKVDQKDITGTLVEPTTPDGTKMPARLLMPDPGFTHHPGKTVWGGVVDQAVRPGIWKDMDNLKGPADYRRRALINVAPSAIADLDESMLLAAGMSDEVYREAFVRRYGEEAVLTDAAGEPVILSLRAFMADKQAGTWKFSKSGHGEMIPLIDRMISEPYEVWLVPQIGADEKIRLTRRYICVWKTADKTRIGGLSVFESSGGVWQGVTQFLPRRKDGAWNLDYVERQRQGVLLWGR